MKKLGIGIIGTGFAKKVQIPAFMACEDASIVSIASGSIDNARSAAAEFGIGHFTDDWRETVAHAGADLVCITTPPGLHREMTLFALEHRKHILCEKPMAMNVGEAEEMAAAAASVPVMAVIDHELRFQTGRQRAFRLLREGVIGKVRHAKAIFQAPHRGDESIPWDWWSDESQGGGALGAIGSHIVDSFHWFLGTQTSRVYCQLQSQVKQRIDSSGELKRVTSDDESNLLVRFADSEVTSDATGLISISMTEGPQYRNALEFYGTDGTMRVEHLGEVFIASNGGAGWATVDTDLGTTLPGMPDTGFARGFMAIARRIVSTLSSGNTELEWAASFADGVQVQKVLDAARLSNRELRAVDL